MTEQQLKREATVLVKLVGVLASSSGKREWTLPAKDGETISGLVTRMLQTVDRKQFTDFLVDSATNDPRPNVIMLLNDADSNLYGGLKAEVSPGSTIVIIPVAHGG